MKFKFTDDIEEIRNLINQNFAQRSSPNDRMLDLDAGISIYGDDIEKRDEFVRDRDRIIYSSAFRRLEHKAQVYSHEKGDHYRTRLTHTIEVMQIARGIARNLDLNEDLTEAIALGHDIGHTPFGHAGEEVLDNIMRGEDDLGGKFKYKINYGGFKHNFHSIKILDVIENKYDNEKGLNLTWQVLEGILKHTSIEKNNKTWDLGRYVKSEEYFLPFIHMTSTPKYSLTLEGQIVSIADEIAQRQHDLDDGLRDIDLQIKDNDIIDYLANIIENLIDEIIDETIETKYAPLNLFLIPNKIFTNNLRQIFQKNNVMLNNSKFNHLNKYISKIDGSKLTKYYKNIILDDENLDDELKLLLTLKNRLKSGKRQRYKWKNVISDIVSYFIHDVTLNTLKNIKEESLCTNNLYFRKNNKKFLLKKYTSSQKSLNLYNKKYWNKRTYSMNTLVDFSKPAKSLDKKIEQYIENRIINSYNVNRFDGKAKFIIRQLFKAYYENPKQMNKNQLNYLSKLIQDNIDNYYDLEFIEEGKENKKVKAVKFDEPNPEFGLDLKNVSNLIKLLKLEFKLEHLNKPDFILDINLIERINGNIPSIKQKWGCLDQETKEKTIFEEILKKINSMDKSAILKEKDEEKKQVMLFIKCLLENHYAYLSVICDYIAGMTDNYAKTEYEKLYLV